MSTLEIELKTLKDNLLEMMELIKNQLIKSRRAVLEADISVAQEVMDIEKRINALELTIDKYCENILALYTPVATDLRFVLAVLRITNDLERIGDNAKSVCRFVVKNFKKNDPDVVRKFGIQKMFDISIDMISQISIALEHDDVALARAIFKQDEILNKKNKSAPKTASILLEKYSDQAKFIVRMLSVVGKLERIGDLIVNIAEEVVFHVEAKVLKHKKRDV